MNAKVQERYGINGSLIIGIIGQKKQGANYPVIISFSVYSPYNGNKLDLDICNEVHLSVEEDIAMKVVNTQKLLHVQELAQQDIDVFNSTSEFYVDICYYYNSSIRKDIAVKDRVKIFYPNITLCENGCSIKGINATTMMAECECKINNLINNNALSDNALYQSQFGEIEELLSQINIDILKCTFEVFKHKSTTSFTGSYIILSLIFVQIILTILYFIRSLNKFKIYIFIILDSFLTYIRSQKNFPPKKTKRSNNKYPEIKCEKTSEENFFDGIDMDSNANEKIKNYRSVKVASTIDRTKSKDIMVISKISEKVKKREEEFDENITESENKINSKYGFNMDEYLETEYEDMIFEVLLERDKRTYCQYFMEQIISKLAVINALCNNERFKPRTIKLLLFVVNIDLYLFINALFMNEEFISEVYYSENNSFIDFIFRSVDRIIYTTLVKVILNCIVDCFFVDEKKIKVILKGKNRTIKEIKFHVLQIMQKTQRKYIYFMIFSFIITLLSLYYITCFNYKYYYITKEWIESSIFIFIFMELLTIVIIFVETSLRFLGLKLSNEKLYKFSIIFS